MPECPNCGQETLRTADWACQWCGYPLLSSSYKKIAKTYHQLKEEKFVEASVAEETAEVVQGSDAVIPEMPLEAESGLEPPLAEMEVTREQTTPVAVEAAETVPGSDAALPEASPQAEPGLELSLAEMEVTVGDLLSAYAEQGAAADENFADKVISLTGMVSRVEINDNLDVYYIILASAGKEQWQSVRCVFEKKHQTELSQLVRGQTVTVRGRYNGSIIDIRMRDCVLVNQVSQQDAY